MQEKEHSALIMGDLMDTQLVTKDRRKIGRVTDIEVQWHDDSHLTLMAIITGPQAMAARIFRPFRKIASWLLRDHFEHRIPMSEIENVGPTVHLRKREADYPLSNSERWIGEHILRWIPGSKH
jgi:hypothetical protein